MSPNGRRRHPGESKRKLARIPSPFLPPFPPVTEQSRHIEASRESQQSISNVNRANLSTIKTFHAVFQHGRNKWKESLTLILEHPKRKLVPPLFPSHCLPVSRRGVSCQESLKNPYRCLYGNVFRNRWRLRENRGRIFIFFLWWESSIGSQSLIHSLEFYGSLSVQILSLDNKER